VVRFVFTKGFDYGFGLVPEAQRRFVGYQHTISSGHRRSFVADGAEERLEGCHAEPLAIVLHFGLASGPECVNETETSQLRHDGRGAMLSAAAP
jgi:hypothetical protein